MKLDTTAPLYDFDGNVLHDTIKGPDGKPKDGPAITARKICMDALTVTVPGEEVAGLEKFERGILALKLRDEPSPVEITIDDAKRIKDLVGKLYGPIVVMQLFALLEGKQNPLAPKE